MPGCDPAIPGTPPTPTVTGDSVINLGDHRTTRSRTEAKGAPVDTRGEPPDSPEAILAQTVQALYLHRSRTLTDPQTAEAYDIALESALLLLDGAQARGGLSDHDHKMLARMLATARRVPGLL